MNHNLPLSFPKRNYFPMFDSKIKRANGGDGRKGQNTLKVLLDLAFCDIAYMLCWLKRSLKL